MKARFAAGIALFVVGLTLPIVAVASSGAPWGFRGHAAVLLETSGLVEMTAGEASIKDKGLSDAAMKPVDGMFLEAGDEVRVARLAEARVKFPNGTVAFGDGARALLTTKGVRLNDGAIEVDVSRGTMPFVVEVVNPSSELRVRPAAESGVVRIVADGKSEVRAYVVRGSVEGVASGGAVSAETGKLLIIGADNKVRAESPPAKLPMEASCDGDSLVVNAPPATQVFALRKLSYPDGGKVILPVNGANEVPVFARDAAGNLAQLSSVKCEKPPPGKGAKK